MPESARRTHARVAGSSPRRSTDSSQTLLFLDGFGRLQHVAQRELRAKWQGRTAGHSSWLEAKRAGVAPAAIAIATRIDLHDVAQLDTRCVTVKTATENYAAMTRHPIPLQAVSPGGRPPPVGWSSCEAPDANRPPQGGHPGGIVGSAAILERG